MENHRRDVGNIGGRREAEGGWDEDISHIHRTQARDGGAVGGSMPDILILCKGTGVRGKGAATRGIIGVSQCHSSGGPTGGATQTEMKGTSWSNRERWWKGVRSMGDVQVDRIPHRSGVLAGGGGARQRREVQGKIK